MKLAKKKKKKNENINFCTYGLTDKVRNVFKKEFNCTKVTEIKLLKKQNVWRANCFQYVGNRQYNFLGTKTIPNNIDYNNLTKEGK